MSTTAFPPVRNDRVRLIGLMAKKPGLSDEEFFKHWHEVHGPLFTNLEVTKKNLLKYEQHHYTTQFEEGAKAMGFDVAPYRGIALFEAESYDKIMEIFASEEYNAIGLPDEQKFLDRSKTGFIPGTIITFIDTDKKA
ncbi:hypothetical protein BD309DRAFT_149726 [Dichomitus squalens]|uniref:EthD domain-containing protein n=1 Tax=Dichomitus squalens TaxID=114155 RepID=A0A4Q9MQL2_9APHY|nr:hypothetical protein BD311DRAFT_660845 [Dichomitus squalens]TBU42838.1 hypothetical protein BD309DRAFT_149726 [Dichomitus squalens]TBU64620.1 hypothetical protein BD310DRAFT_406035 [Dichomitus squalens]